jgi:hypothetical protein
MKKNKKKGLLKRLSSIDDIKDNFILTKNLIKEKSKASKTKFIKESFSDALRRLSITKENEETHLTRVYKQLKITFFSYLISSMLVTVLTTYQLYFGVELGYLFYAAYLISLALFIKSVECAFRCSQIRIRELGGLTNFLLSAKQWYPKKYIYKGDV